MITAAIFTILSIAGALVTSAQTLLVAAFRRRRGPFAGSLHEQASRRDGSFISILKPVCGLDDELYENLISFACLSDVCHEVIVSAESDDDPALAVVRRVMHEYPFAPYRIVIDGGCGTGVVNRKVERLVAAARVARGDVLFISDSNVRITPETIAHTVAELAVPGTGCVSNIFTGSGARTLGARLESTHLLAFVVPGCVLAAWKGVPCVVGKSMAITREALDAVGGFEAFVHVLAEDQAIGIAIRGAGYRIALSPAVVRNVTVRRTLRGAVDRQIRWNKIRFAFSRKLYASELILNPLALGLATLNPVLIVSLAALRIAQFAALAALTGTRVAFADLLVAPLLDLVMLYAWFVPFFSNRVSWRGYEARIGPGTALVQAA